MRSDLHAAVCELTMRPALGTALTASLASPSAQSRRSPAAASAVLQRSAAGVDLLDLEIRETTATFVRQQPSATKAFAQRLSETAAFKSLLEAMALTPDHWPRWLRLFDAHASAAAAARGSPARSPYNASPYKRKGATRASIGLPGPTVPSPARFGLPSTASSPTR